MTTLHLRQEIDEWFKDFDGVLTTPKKHDETNSYSFDWTDRLHDETISTSTWEADGITVNNSANTTTTTTVSVTGSGEAKNTIVTSASRTLIEKFRWIGVDISNADYGN